MKLTERNELIKWANNLSDEQLEDEYYDAVFDSLGSTAEKMYVTLETLKSRKNMKNTVVIKPIFYAGYVKRRELNYGKNNSGE